MRGLSRNHPRWIKVANARNAHQGHGAIYLFLQDVKHMNYSPFPIHRHPIKIGTPNQNSTGAEGERLDDIAAATDSAVEQDLSTVSYGGHDIRKRVERWTCEVELPSTVVGHDDPGDPQRDRALGVAGGRGSP